LPPASHRHAARAFRASAISLSDFAPARRISRIIGRTLAACLSAAALSAATAFFRALGRVEFPSSIPRSLAAARAALVRADYQSPPFQSGRDFAAWIGLVPRQDSTGGKQKLGPISKRGHRYLRRILVVVAHSVLRRARQNPRCGQKPDRNFAAQHSLPPCRDVLSLFGRTDRPDRRRWCALFGGPAEGLEMFDKKRPAHHCSALRWRARSRCAPNQPRLFILGFV
jgi:hypothetical protein